MTTTKPPPPAPRTTAPPGRLRRMTRDSAIGSRIVLYGVEGWGKTSLAVQEPDTAVIMCRGEQGYQTLVTAGSVPECDAAHVETWGDLLAVTREIADSGTYKQIVIDALGGVETMAKEHVTAAEFGGNAGEKGFMSFGKGWARTGDMMLTLLSALDKPIASGVNVVLIGHAAIKTFANPTGANYDQYVVAMEQKNVWPLIARWSDAVLFGKFLTLVDGEKQGKGKGVGGDQRVLYAEGRDAFVAKNRYGLPAEMMLTADPAENWGILKSYLKEANNAV